MIDSSLSVKSLIPERSNTYLTSNRYTSFDVAEKSRALDQISLTYILNSAFLTQFYKIAVPIWYSFLSQSVYLATFYQVFSFFDIKSTGCIKNEKFVFFSITALTVTAPVTIITFFVIYVFETSGPARILSKLVIFQYLLFQ